MGKGASAYAVVKREDKACAEQMFAVAKAETCRTKAERGVMEGGKSSPLEFSCAASDCVAHLGRPWSRRGEVVVGSGPTGRCTKVPLCVVLK